MTWTNRCSADVLPSVKGNPCFLRTVLGKDADVVKHFFPQSKWIHFPKDIQTHCNCVTWSEVISNLFKLLLSNDWAQVNVFE